MHAGKYKTGLMFFENEIDVVRRTDRVFVLQKSMQMETVDYIELVRGMYSVENNGFCLWKTLKDTGHEAEVVDSE